MQSDISSDTSSWGERTAILRIHPNLASTWSWARASMSRFPAKHPERWRVCGMPILLLSISFVPSSGLIYLIVICVNKRAKKTSETTYMTASQGKISQHLSRLPCLWIGENTFEALLCRPLSQKTQEGFFRIGLFLLISLMFFTTFNDLKDLGLFR